MDDREIGIFDSGIGGLTVLQSLSSLLPKERYIYIGDNLHCTYGDKTNEQLYAYACNIIEYLLARQVKLIVVACNTISSNILPLLRLKYPKVEIIGVIDATCKQVINANIKKTLVIGTKGTITSHAYKKSIEAIKPSIIADELMTPSLVPLIESGSKENIKRDLHQYLDNIITHYDGLILGCTHYPIIESMIRKITGDRLIINSSAGVANEVSDYLIKHNLMGNKKEIQIYTTGDVQKFISSSECFFDYGETKVNRLNL